MFILFVLWLIRSDTHILEVDGLNLVVVALVDGASRDDKILLSSFLTVNALYSGR